MSGEVILDGRIRVRPEMSNFIVNAAGVSFPFGVTVDLNVGTNAGVLKRTIVRKTAGTPSVFTVNIYDMADLNPDALIFSSQTTEPTDIRLDMWHESGLHFANAAATKLYAQVIPAMGTGHAFTIRVMTELYYKV